MMTCRLEESALGWVIIGLHCSQGKWGSEEGVKSEMKWTWRRSPGMVVCGWTWRRRPEPLSKGGLCSHAPATSNGHNVYILPG